MLVKRHDAAITQRLVSAIDGRPAAGYGEYQSKTSIVRLLLPLTMMNESGEAIRDLGVEPSNMLVVCDDVNLPLGALRLRAQGSAGGHNGLASCLEVLGTEQVSRLRVGVGRSPIPKDLEEFVLSPFDGNERPIATQAINRAAEACDAWIVDGVDVAMNRFNITEEP